MMTREEVAEIMIYCKEHGITYKSRLVELDIPLWKFYDSKAHYAREDEKSKPGEFLELRGPGCFVPMPSFASTSGKKPASKRKQQDTCSVSVEMKTSNGSMMRIQGDLSPVMLQSIILAAGGHV